jgi:hypothetical protein
LQGLEGLLAIAVLALFFRNQEAQLATSMGRVFAQVSKGISRKNFGLDEAKVFKKYSQMKLQMKREALVKLNRMANDRPQSKTPVTIQHG